MQWGKLIDSNRDEGRIFHLLKADWSPACGVRYFSSAAYPDAYAPFEPRCRKCAAILARATAEPPDDEPHDEDMREHRGRFNRGRP